jgi:muramoyltetrapeptide carboxypeptidase
MRKPRALRPGDRIAIVAPASPFTREDFDAGVGELRTLGFDPVYREDVFACDGYLAGPADLRARSFHAAWTDPDVAGIVAVRGGYGSVQMLPLLDPRAMEQQVKAFVGYSDNTSLLTWLNQECGLVAFHGPMIAGRLAKGPDGYDRDTFERCLCRAAPVGEIVHPQLETIVSGEASGPLVGGTLTQLTASLGTPFAFCPPPGSILFVDEIAERPYRLDRMFTQLRLAGILARISGVVFGELPGCDEPGGNPDARSTIRRLFDGFPGPVLYGLPSGHTDGACITLPFGVRARAIGGANPALVIEEAAVEQD